VLQVNFRSIYNKAIEFWIFLDMYNSDVTIGTESWLKEEISNLDIFRTDFKTFRIDRSAHGSVVFISVKNSIACTELWADEDVETIAVEMKGMDPKYSRESIGIYRAPNEDMLAIERLVARTKRMRDAAK
jgi:hypothetical protein